MFLDQNVSQGFEDNSSGDTLANGGGLRCERGTHLGCVDSG